jgi:hypothetical protein
VEVGKVFYLFQKKVYDEEEKNQDIEFPICFQTFVPLSTFSISKNFKFLCSSVTVEFEKSFAQT